MSLATYTDNLKHEYASGVTTEHSYRGALKSLLESVEQGLTVVNEPKRIEVGAPDYYIDRSGVYLGAVEAKDIDENLDHLDRRSQQQLEDYKEAIPNLIHTNYLHFRWYVLGELVEDVSIGELRDKKITIQRERFDELAGMLHRFINKTTPTIGSPRDLAQRMAAMARQIAVLINNSLPDSDTLQAQMAAFEQTLMPGLGKEQFADMYAQTLAYGLFAARVRYGQQPPDGFTLQNAFWNMPETNPFLKRFFQEIAPELDDRVRWQADILASLLAHARMDDILRDFGRRTRTEDPVVHFYETFLAVYNPAERERRGVYYTPEPVVSYIVRSVDHLLRERFGRYDGLADANTLVLDPATGTGTFLYFVIDLIYERLKGQRGMWDTYVRESLLPRIFGFELLMAPYAVAHMKLGIQLQELNYQFQSGQRLGIYLTNTLEEAVKQGQQQFAQFINHEANEAARIKREEPIMVVLGNPPYSGHSANKGQWIRDLVRDYYKVDGKPMGERNPKWLQDDYVKFIRFGQWRIGETGSGVLTFVSNNGYIDNPTFRGMRQQLMQAFDDIYIFNLHGNSRKRETTPDGNTDENVFDIQQGVAIGIFVKHDVGAHGRAPLQTARVHYADLWGLREQKYAALVESDVANTDWQELTPQAPYYLFVPQNLDLAAEYEVGWKVTEVFPQDSMGITSGNDEKYVAYSETELKAQFEDLSKVINVAYRPFDVRKLYYDADLLARARYDFMRHLRHSENYALNTLRRPRNEIVDNFFVTTLPTDKCIISTLDNAQVFPLYLYPDPNDKKLFADDGDWPAGKDGRVPNLNPAFVRDMEARLGLRFVVEGAGVGAQGLAPLQGDAFTPEDVFYYAYAVFHSPTYRERYAEFLKIDFPRLPLTGDVGLFRALVERGRELVDLHLVRHPRQRSISGLMTQYAGTGSDEVERGYPQFTPHPPAPSPTRGEGEQGRVYINKTKYFEGIEADDWDFHIGGYQVLEKWLKDRRGRALSGDDILHYQRVVVALHETRRLMDEIDEAIPAWPIV